MEIEALYSILNGVLKDKVFYGSNIYDNGETSSMPYIVYQELSKRPIGYSDDSPITYTRTIQITLVVKAKNLALERKLEEVLKQNKLNFSMISESHNSDKSINRVYEIHMEDL